MINPLIKSLPLIASALGKRYGVRVFIGGDKAMSDGKDIYLPSLPIDSSTELINLTRGYLDHEAAHIRETDFRALKSARLTPVEFHVSNIIEDHRVERVLGAQYPGCRENFEWLVRRFFDHDPEPGRPLDLMALDWILLTVRGWSVPAVGYRADCLSVAMENECPGLIERIRPVLDGAMSDCQDTAASIKYAREIVRALEAFRIQSDCQAGCGDDRLPRCDNPGPSRGQQGHKAAGAKDKPPVGERVALPDDDDGQAHEGSQALDGTEHIGKTGQSPIVQSRSIVKNLLDRTAGELPRPFDGQVEACLGDTASECVGGRITVATPNGMALEELSGDDLAEARRATQLLKGRLLGLLQGLTIKPASPGQRGRLEPCLLHRVCLGSPRVFRRKGTRTGLDVAVHLLMDASGSMGGLARLASQTAYSICEALAAVPGVNVAATAFPGNPTRKPGSKDLDWSTVAPMLRHGQPPHRHFGMSASGNTPLAEALWWVTLDMACLRESRKMAIVVTDGEPDSVLDARTAIKFAQDAGIELYGLGLGSDSVKGLMPGRNIVINNIMDMPRKLFWLLGQAMKHDQ